MAVMRSQRLYGEDSDGESKNWPVDEEFVKRAGFVLMAALDMHDEKEREEVFLIFLPTIKTGAGDDRNFVKTSVNWTLRQIGKRNVCLNQDAMKTAEEICEIGSQSVR